MPFVAKPLTYPAKESCSSCPRLCPSIMKPLTYIPKKATNRIKHPLKPRLLCLDHLIMQLFLLGKLLFLIILCFLQPCHLSLLLMGRQYELILKLCSLCLIMRLLKLSNNALTLFLIVANCSLGTFSCVLILSYTHLHMILLNFNASLLSLACDPAHDVAPVLDS